MGQEFHPVKPPEGTRFHPSVLEENTRGRQGGRGKQIDADKTIFYLLSPADGGRQYKQEALFILACLKPCAGLARLREASGLPCQKNSFERIKKTGTKASQRP